MKTRYALLAATLLATGVAGYAAAQDAATYDPAQLPQIKGKVAEYSLTPRGDVDGLILGDGTEVHMPPYLGTQLVFAVKPGDAVTIRGLHARAVPMVQAMSITNDASNATVTDNGPREMRGPMGSGQELTAQGTIKADLHGPRGDVDGVLLSDGTIVRLPPPEMRRLAAQLTVGATVYARGDGYAGPLGHVIAANAIGPSEAQLTQVQTPRPHGPGERGKFGPEGHRRGPGAPGGPGAPPPPPPPGGPTGAPTGGPGAQPGPGMAPGTTPAARPAAPAAPTTTP